MTRRRGDALKRRLLIGVAVWSLAAAAAAREQIEFRNVGEMVKLSDLIARVTVVSVRETGEQDGHARVAWVRVVEGFKGAEAGEFFELGSDTVRGGVPIACPNVTYSAGEDVLLFAKRLPDGKYQTLYADAGKFPVTDGRISKAPFPERQTYESAAAAVRRELKKSEAAAKR
jgi:hypothetical protein